MNPKPSSKIAEPSDSPGYAQAVEPAADTCVDSDVAMSFREFDELNEEAEEMEIPPPSVKNKRLAKQILTGLTQEFPRYYMISPDEDNGVSIETIGKTGRVLVVCDDDGVACFSLINGVSAHMRCDPAADKQLFDDFTRSVLRKLK